ncbi:MAG: hypothetical protein VX246_13335 [Myxococcota bacterium]|nr:hypothetical protein [Myxococcota bacterium]
MRTNSTRTRMLRLALSVAVACCWLWIPLAAQADPTPRYNAQCKKLTRQIERYEGVADMARERGDDPWLEGTLAHIERLDQRRSRLCPAYDQSVLAAANAKFWKDTYALTKQIAQGAARYFTFGMY